MNFSSLQSPKNNSHIILLLWNSIVCINFNLSLCKDCTICVNSQVPGVHAAVCVCLFFKSSKSWSILWMIWMIHQWFWSSNVDIRWHCGKYIVSHQRSSTSLPNARWKMIDIEKAVFLIIWEDIPSGLWRFRCSSNGSWWTWWTKMIALVMHWKDKLIICSTSP